LRDWGIEGLMKKLAIIVLIALIHFGSSVLIVATSMSILTGADTVPAAPTFGVRILVAATRILHFPVVSLSWYSRQWFPGDWIYVPIIVNSFIWAAGIYVLYLLGKKIIEKKRNVVKERYF
jgi:hypothetical protein